MSSTLPENREERVTDRPLAPAAVGDELAPSLVRDDDLALPRAVGTIAAAVTLFGGMALALNLSGWPRVVDTGTSVLILAVGMAGLLFHAAFDRDVQFRRLYMTFGLASLFFGTALAAASYTKTYAHLLPWSIPLLGLGLLFFLCFARNETDEGVRTPVQAVFGVAGALLGATGLVVSLFHEAFFLPLGFVLSVVGLLYLGSFVGSRGTADDRAYNAALGVAAFGALMGLLVLGRSLFTPAGSSFFISVGFLMLVVSLAYVAVGAGMALDWPLFVLTRRELASFFLSPVAYLCLLAFVLCSWVTFAFFVLDVYGQPAVEPVFQIYAFNFFPVVVLLVVVPVLTMRLLSEEQRVGTLEVLLTAPVDEPVVVLAKFLAGMLMYLIVWVPFGLMLLAIPAFGGPMFDYRPMLSYFLVLVVTGAMFISMGLFCSSLTSSQIASFLLSFVGMLMLTAVYFIVRSPAAKDAEPLLRHVSYLNAWLSAIAGRVVLRELVFPLSATVLFLFLTVKVLESRKWR